MAQSNFNTNLNSTKFENLTKEDLIQRNSILTDELSRAIKEIYQLKNQSITDSQLNLLLSEQFGDLQNTVFGSSSEKYKKSESEKIKTDLPPKPRIQRPSERYPNLPVIEKIISMTPVPDCSCCGHGLSDSGMTEDSEQLTVIPKKYEITLQKRIKYDCEKCHGDLRTATLPARIKDGSVYSDEMIIDVALSKYCDLIPIDRYSAMAARSGVMDIPPQSLIELTHYLSDFVVGAYLKLRDQVLESRVLAADETPHRMLEGSDKKSWYLWGFSTSKVCYLECRDTRSGDVASDVLLNSKCEVLLSDVYSGYNKAIRMTNEIRLKNNKNFIKNANCNAHARRYFFKSRLRQTTESEYYLDCYREIYKLNAESKLKSHSEILEIRSKMASTFEAMKAKTFEDLQKFPHQNQFSKALRYFIENYDELTLFLTDTEVPIDNNAQERVFRSHVVGRKTWYGTHSERGAITASILFSLVESCKLNLVNPREYFKNLVQDLLLGEKPYTPAEFKESH